VLEPRARAVMAELTIAVGRPMVHDLRAMCDAVSYVVKTGSSGVPSRSTSRVGGGVRVLRAVNGRGLPQELVTRLRELLRRHQGRAAQPTACIIDSQMVKAHDTVPRKTSGYHGGKKITGRGRHVAVDTEGWLLALVVTAASVSDKGRGRRSCSSGCSTPSSTLKIMWGRQRLRRQAAGPLRASRRRDHRRGRQAHRPALLPGAASAAGSSSAPSAG